MNIENSTFTKLYLYGIAFFCLCFIGTTRAEDFKLTVFRQYSSSTCTSGYLAVNGTIKCYTLERPWKDNMQNVSSIPAGTYAANLRYDHSDHWRVELVGVPGRTNVQIHIGNQPDQTLGCILVGQKLDLDLCSLEDSAKALRDIKNAFYGTDSPVATPDKKISVQIVDGGK
jgi:hypothetical protein